MRRIASQAADCCSILKTFHIIWQGQVNLLSEVVAVMWLAVLNTVAFCSNLNLHCSACTTCGTHLFSDVPSICSAYPTILELEWCCVDHNTTALQFDVQCLCSNHSLGIPAPVSWTNTRDQRGRGGFRRALTPVNRKLFPPKVCIPFWTTGQRAGGRQSQMQKQVEFLHVLSLIYPPSRQGRDITQAQEDFPTWQKHSWRYKEAGLVAEPVFR